MKLSKRLETVASMVTKGNRAADVGCDHGFVPIFLVKSGISPSAVAADVRPGPLSRAKEHIKEHGLEKTIQTRLSDGLANIKPGEADSLVMSGIGGILMVRLLTDGCETAKSFRELILSPQSELADVRRYLVANGYFIEYEHMLCDEGKFYFVFHVIIKKDERDWAEDEYRYGKEICAEDQDTFQAYLEKETRQYEQILEKMKQAPQNDRAVQRIAQLQRDIACVEKRQGRISEKENVTGGFTYYEMQ